MIPVLLRMREAAAMCSKGLDSRVGCEPSADAGIDAMSAFGTKRTSRVSSDPLVRSQGKSGHRFDLSLMTEVD